MTRRAAIGTNRTSQHVRFPIANGGYPHLLMLPSSGAVGAFSRRGVITNRSIDQFVYFRLRM